MDSTCPVTPNSLAALTIAVAVSVCYACNTPFEEGEEELQCKVSGCANRFHYACGTASTLTNDEKAEWVCPQCRCSVRKTGDYSHTPVGTSKIRAGNITFRKPANPNKDSTPERLQFPSTQYLEIMSEVRLIREDMAVINDMLKQVMSKLVQYDTTIEKLTTKLSENTSKSPLQNDQADKLVSECRYQVNTYSDAAAGLKKGRVNTVTSSSNAPRKNGASSATPNDESNMPNLQGGTRADFAKDVSDREEPASMDIPRDNENSEWQLVGRRKSQRRLTSLRCTAGPNVTSLVAVEHRKHIHLWNMVSGIDDVRAYVQTLCPGATCTVEELKPRGDYKSYKIGVPAAHIDTYLSPHVWPENARVKVWFFRGRRGSGQQDHQKPTEVSS